MTMEPTTLVMWLGVAIGGVAAGFYGARKGGVQGASVTLNGTANAVKRIEAMIGTMGGKLDGHIADTAHRFDALSSDVQDTRERVATIEGTLSVKPGPKRPAPRRR